MCQDYLTACATATATLTVPGSPVDPVDPVERGVVRHAGRDRIATAVATSRRPAGAAAATTTVSPVLLVPPTGLTQAGSTALRGLSPLQVVVLGGEGAVPAAVEAQLRQHLRD